MNFALVAHDAKKVELRAWVEEHFFQLSKMKIICTKTTGNMIKASCGDLNIVCVKSGPFGGDQQIGAMICEQKVDALIFFIDPLSSMPHDVDVKALMRLAALYDVPMACSKSTANLILHGLARQN